MNRLVAILAVLSVGPIAHAEDGPIVGAIRWDAWTGGKITREVERSLGPKKYHTRLPWFAEVVDENTVRIDGSPQAVMDQEIGVLFDDSMVGSGGVSPPFSFE